MILPFELERPLAFLDLETTGLGNTAQVCQLGVIDQDGNTVVSTLVKPTVPIEASAATVTGIDDAAVIGLDSDRITLRRADGADTDIATPGVLGFAGDGFMARPAENSVSRSSDERPNASTLSFSKVPSSVRRR